MAKYMVFDWGQGLGRLDKPLTRFLGTTSELPEGESITLTAHTVSTDENILQGVDRDMLVMSGDFGPVMAFMEIEDRTSG